MPTFADLSADISEVSSTSEISADRSAKVGIRESFMNTPLGYIPPDTLSFFDQTITDHHVAQFATLV